MEIKKFERADFLAWVGGEDGVGARARSGLDLMRGEVAVVAEGARERGTLLVVRDSDELLDFFAFAGTYISTYLPFSSFFRVITLSDFEGTPSVPEFGEELLKRALAGAIICGSVARSGAKQLRDILLPDVLGSEIFAIGKAMLSSHFKSVSDISSRWRHANDLVLQNGPSVHQDSLSPFWQNLHYVLFKDSLLIMDDATRPRVEFVRSVLRDNSITNDVWSAMLELAPFLEEYRSDMEGSRERRARVFTKAAQSTEMERLGADADVAIAFLGVLLAGGSFDYAGLVSGLSEVYPSVAEWFGFMAGALANSDVLTAGQSIGRHIVKNMNNTSELLNAPECDISFDELRVFSRGRDSLAYLPKRARDSVSVELIPGTVVDIVLPSGMGNRSNQDAKVRAAIYEARRLIGQAQRVLGEGVTGESDDLFEPPSRRKSSRR